MWHWKGVCLLGGGEEQDIYWKAFKSQKSSKRWTIALIKHLITTAWDIWQHQNEVLHKSEQNQQDIVEHDINQQIWQIYEQEQGQIMQVTKQLMKWPLQCLL